MFYAEHSNLIHIDTLLEIGRREDDKKLKCPRGHPEATGSLPMAKMLRLAVASQVGVALRRLFEPYPLRFACGDGSP